MEEWKWVKDYEGLYMVSSHGHVMSVPKPTHYGHVMKPKITSQGYCYVCLCKNSKKKSVRVHRLVAEAFIPNPHNKPEVNHKDGNGANNDVSNLEWVTRSENELHAYRVLGKKPNKPWLGKPRKFARLFTDDQVRCIRSDNRPNTEIAKDYGVSKTAIRDIKTRKNYTEVF